MEALIPITMFMCIAAVAILRPISTKLGGLLEAMKNEKTGGRTVDDPDIARVRVLMEHVVKRVDLMEERLDFTERLLNNPRRTVDSRDEMLRPGEAGARRSHESEMLRP